MTDRLEKITIGEWDNRQARLAQLQHIFPDVFRDGKVNFVALQEALGTELEPSQARFGLEWAGKRECKRLIQGGHGTLLPQREQSVAFDTSDNVIIEGENLEALKILQKSYHAKIKMIYIDPPYNTGKDFIYPDNYHESAKQYLTRSQQVDKEGVRLIANQETNGRFHSDWLSMMWPRLTLARNLLRDDGVIFVSIDDNEVHLICANKKKARYTVENNILRNWV